MEQKKKGTGITGHTHMVAMIGSPVGAFGIARYAFTGLSKNGD